MSSSLFVQILYEVDWREEPWLLCLLACHVLTTTAILLLHKHPYLQAPILATLGVLCFASQWINEYAALNWSLFSKEQYFDHDGFFIFTVFSGPIILNCLLIVLCWMWQVWQMMVDLGRTKTRRKAAQATKQAATAKKKQ